MTLSYILMLLVAGAGAGVLSGLLGIGGGLVSVPVLVYVFMGEGLSAHDAMPLAVGTSLACIVLTGASSARAHARRGSVDWGLWRTLAPLIALGAMLGGVGAGHVNSRFLILLFATFSYLMAAKSLGVKLIGGQVAARVYQNRIGRTVLGSGIGLMSSLLGVGGGTMTVPLLLALNVPTKLAIGTGAALGLSVAVPAVVGVLVAGLGAPPAALPYSFGALNLPAFLCVSVGGLLCAPLGTRLAHKLPDIWLKRTLALLLLVVGTKMLLI